MNQSLAHTSARIAAPFARLGICGATDIGLRRADNQDTFLVADLRSGDTRDPGDRRDIPLSRMGLLMLICDGMGGAAAGGLAARIAAEAIKEQLVGVGPAVAKYPAEVLEAAVWGANGAVLAETRAHPETRGMGTTCTAAVLLPERLVVAQVGDSRAYLFRDGSLHLLTRDQTVANELIDSGVLQSEDLATLAYRHILRQAVGTQPTIRPVTTEAYVRRGDRILLCSDGLHGPVSDPEISRILGSALDIDRAAHRLIQTALVAGGPDNVTVVLADCQ